MAVNGKPQPRKICRTGNATEKLVYCLEQRGRQCVYRIFSKRMQACPDQVEDLVQEVLLAIHIKRHTYDNALPISSWIHAIAKYKYIDFLRARRHAIDQESLDDASELFGQCDNLAQESQRDVGKLLLTLPDSFRIPIQLTKLEGHSVKEASQISGMSESAIKIGIHRGLKKLASTLGFEYEH